MLDSAALLHDIGLVGVPRQIIRRWQEHTGQLATLEADGRLFKELAAERLGIAG